MTKKDSENDSLHIDNILHQAIEHHRANRLEDAENMYLEILKIQAQHPVANYNLGLLALQFNKPDTALPYLKAALESNPKQGQYWLSYIDTLILAGDLINARRVLQQAQRHGLRGTAVDNLEKRLSSQQNKLVKKTPSSKKSKKITNISRFSGKKDKKKKQRSQKSLPNQSDNKEKTKDSILNIEQALQKYNSDNFNDAQQILQKIIKSEKNNSLAYWYLSIITQESGKIDEAISIIKECLSLNPDFSHGYNSLGLFYYQKKMSNEAIECFQRAITINPCFAEAFYNSGMVLYTQGRTADAINSYKKAIELQPDFKTAYNNIGLILKNEGRLDEAEDCYKKAVAIDPHYVEAYNNLGITLKEKGQLYDAEDCYRKAIDLRPNYAEAYNNLGNVISETGRLKEAEDCYRKALALKPDFYETHSNLLFNFNLNPDSTDIQRFTEARNYHSKIHNHCKQFTQWPATKLKTPPLRIGFVSGDLKSHPVGYFLANVLNHLYGNEFELFAYYTQSFEDHLTKRIKPCFSTWRCLENLSDQEAAQCIHNDAIHILVDLAGHTALNRLPIFARKPAPVQVSWLGYFATTGLDQIDYLITDEISVAHGQNKFFSEQICYLPTTRLCFTPPDLKLETSPLPALNRKYITFGCYQNLGKLNDTVLAVWSEILNSLPSSMLRIQNRTLNDPVVRAHFVNRLKDNGININQVQFHGGMTREAYFKTYADVDIILDTFPYPGGTTTCEALWMGVPTLTLTGNTLLERQGVSLLNAAGLPEWIATDVKDYINKALCFSQDVSSLAQLRDGLRKKVEQTPLFNAELFTDNLKTTFMKIWNNWQEKNT